MITPAISVLSAIEGLEVAAPSLASLVTPITLTVLTTLFAIQRFGTRLVGSLFGPVMAVWFGVLALVGVVEIAPRPEVMRALSPTYGAQFVIEHSGVAFIALASVVLAVTGAEALYADMGHFGRPPIRRVVPARLPRAHPQLRGAGIIDPPFPRGDCEPVLPPGAFVGADTDGDPRHVATVIASQAVISGAFSLTRQAVGLGFLPQPDQVLRTSRRSHRNHRRSHRPLRGRQSRRLLDESSRGRIG